MADPARSWRALPDELKRLAIEQTPGEPFPAELARRFAQAGVDVVPAAVETTTGQPMFRFSRAFAWFLHRRSRIRGRRVHGPG